MVLILFFCTPYFNAYTKGSQCTPVWESLCLYFYIEKPNWDSCHLLHLIYYFFIISFVLLGFLQNTAFLFMHRTVSLVCHCMLHYTREKQCCSSACFKAKSQKWFLALGVYTPQRKNTCGMFFELQYSFKGSVSFCLCFSKKVKHILSETH